MDQYSNVRYYSLTDWAVYRTRQYHECKGIWHDWHADDD